MDREAKAIAIHDATGKTPVPCATLALLMLGPGTSITHAAIQAAAACGCLIIWCGEQGVRFYAQGMGENRSSTALLRQAALCSNEESRLRVAMKMYKMRFAEKLPDDLTIQQIRGMEGVRVREAYAKASKITGVKWTGRSYNRGNWSEADPVNRALSCANSCLYGICHAAIVSLGYSPGLGFIHTGKQLSFVYDVADLYKADTTIPVAFSIAAGGDRKLESRTRKGMRDLIAEKRILRRIVEDLDTIFSDDAEPSDEENSLDFDVAKPGSIWDPEHGNVAGGVNYGDGDAEGGISYGSDGS